MIYSSHTLEHLTRQDGRKLLAQCHRVLCKGGIIRLVVPDLRAIVDEYIEGRYRADEFVEKLGVVHRPRAGLKGHLSSLMQFPLHRCMYDRPCLSAVLRETRFEASERQPFDSDIENIRAVEIGDLTIPVVIMEGRKS